VRKRELIKRLKSDQQELNRTCNAIFSDRHLTQQRAERRLILLHALEGMLPEIIEKLEQQP